MRRWIAPPAALTLVLLLCPGGWAGSPTEELRGFFAAAARALDDPEALDKPEERLSAIRAILGDIFDFREAARLSLGPDWIALTPEEREEFVRLFADLLERSYILGVASRIRLADGVKVSYLGESIDGDVATVRATMLSRSGLDLPFDYRMIERGDRWAVRDVVIDGVSLAANYRAQFARVIQASSYAGLVRQMQAKVSGAPAAPRVTIAVADSRAIAPAAPAPPPTGMTPEESTEPTARGQLAETPSDLQRRGLATGARSAERDEPMAAPIAPAEPEPATIRPKRAAEAASARKEPDPAAPPRERGVRPDQLQVVTAAARPLGAPVASSRSYWIQVGAFKNPEAARRLASRLREQTPLVSSRWAVAVETGPAGAPLARVRVGPFPDRVEAASKLRELQARGYEPFIAEQRD